MTTRVDLTFAETFSARETRIGAEEEGTFYPGSRPHEAREGVAVEITPDGQRPWVGVFSPCLLPLVSRRVFVAAHPGDAYLGVVNCGEGYLVNVRNPHDWQEVAGPVVEEVLVVRAVERVVYIGMCDAAGYG